MNKEFFKNMRRILIRKAAVVISIRAKEFKTLKTSLFKKKKKLTKNVKTILSHKLTFLDEKKSERLRSFFILKIDFESQI